MSRSLFDKKKIIVCCGSGGVGKTTLSAAIALEAASRGKKTVVTTIDPAKRLAMAMGLSELSNELVEIDLAGSPPAAYRRPPAGGRLYAMMLDTKRTFDRLIEKHASPATREAILSNKLYQHMSNMIAGSQEYMAMEKLYELYHDGDFEFIVLDTPPTRHAMDFLDAPNKMINVTGNSLLKWLLKPGLFLGQAGRIGAGVLQKGAEKILSVFDRLAGFSFLHELSEMVSLLSDLMGGFHDRAQAVSKLLREEFVGFLLVTSPASVAIQDALYFHQKIKEYGLPFVGFVINRVHPEGISAEFVGARRAAPLQTLSPPLREKVLECLRDQEQLALRDQKAVALLKKLGGRNTLFATIPLFATDVHDLEGLRQINEGLFGSG